MIILTSTVLVKFITFDPKINIAKLLFNQADLDGSYQTALFVRKENAIKESFLHLIYAYLHRPFLATMIKRLLANVIFMSPPPTFSLL